MKLAGVVSASALLASAATGCKASQDRYDVVVVGAGIVGCCCARELARYNLNVLVVEAGLDIANGATRANSGIVHAGFDPTPGTLKAHYNVAGAAAYPQWQAELGFTYIQNGALVLAFDEAEKPTLETLVEQAKENGTDQVSLIDAGTLHEIESQAPAAAIAALYAPKSAVVDPYGVAFAAAENAVDNGVEFLFGHEIINIEKTTTGFSLEIESKGGALAANDNTKNETDATLHAADSSYRYLRQTITCSCILNAAGIHADNINNMVSTQHLEITAKRGEYLLYQQHSPFTHTMFQAPTAAGKGVLVGQTVFGNLFIGPNSEAQESKDDVSTTAEGLADIFAKAQKTFPQLTKEGVISTFAGLRASNAQGSDFVIGQAEDVPGFFNAACIDSPGLASAPAIAEDLAARIATYLKRQENPQFNPMRQAAPLFAFADEETKQRLLAEDAAYGITTCACYGVTQAEIAHALHGKLPVYSLDALKWRTGATMGPCQGSKCLAKIAAIVAEELNASPLRIEKRAPESYVGISEISPDLAADINTTFDDALIERPRASYLIPGTRPAGVYAARDVLELMANDLILPGYSVLIWGNTEYAQRAHDVLTQAGASVAFLDEDDVPCEIVGYPRVMGVVVQRNGQQQTIACDTFVISKDLVSLE